MKPFKIYALLIPLLFWSLTHLSAKDKTLTIGDLLPKIAAKDQYDEIYEMSEDTKYVVVSLEMSPGKSANAYFSKKAENYLSDNKAIVVANIYGMPSIGRFFAFPKMKKYPHRILLVDEEGFFDDFPIKKGKSSIITLGENGVIHAIKYWDAKNESNPFE